MSGIDGLNVFGSLTAANGKRVDLKDFDANNDGVVSAEEWEQGIKDFELDKLELSTADANGDKIIDEDEFAVLEQKADIQAALNEYQATIAKDFTGENAEYAKNVQDRLKEYATDFVAKYTGEIKDMATQFKADLPDKYAEIKEDILNQTPEALATKKEAEQKAIKSKVIEQIVTTISNDTNSGYSSTVSKAVAKAVGKKLEGFAADFIKNYTGDDLEADLSEYLNSKLNETERDLMGAAIAVYNNGVDALGNYIDSDELEELKTLAKTLLSEALDKGITVKFGGKTIKNVSAITTVLKSYTDGDDLKDAVQNFINSLSTDDIISQILKTEESNAAAASYNNFTKITGSEYKIDASLIDYSSISGYFDGGEISANNRCRSSAVKIAEDEGRETLNNESLKSQMKNQIKSMLEAKGIDFSQIETVFENVYSDTINATLSQDGMYSTNRIGCFPRIYKVTIDIKTLVDTFITNFNTNIAKAIDEMNASDKDMDLQDIDYSVLGEEDVNGNTDNLEDKYKTGDNLTSSWSEDSSTYDSVAEKSIEKLKPQMLAKARAMCSANGVEFDESTFATMFNNAKGIAVAAGLTKTTILRHTKSILNTKTLINTFTQEFKTSYTAWVNSKKTK
jgi:ribosomal protein S20